MTIRTATARTLCTKPEFALYQASLARNVKAVTPGRLKQKVARSRSLRDKYRSLARTQAREGRGNERTLQKAQLFQEVLDRFQAEAKGRPPAAPKPRASGRKKAPAKKSAPKRAVNKPVRRNKTRR